MQGKGTSVSLIHWTIDQTNKQKAYFYKQKALFLDYRM